MSIFTHSQNLLKTDFFDRFVDYHSHILPCVDDGLKSMSEALETLSYYEKLGINKVVLTPHINKQCPHNDLHKKQFADLLQTYKGTIKLHLAAEYMLDAGFEEQMNKGLRYVSDQRVLVETSFTAAPNNLYELLYKIALKGDIPLIAHPERYLYMNKHDYFNLKAKGYEFQLNLLSLSGIYGKDVKHNAIFLLKNNMYNYIGTDIHSLEKFKKVMENMQITKKLLNLINVIRHETNL